jgi:hypothetical protein
MFLSLFSSKNQKLVKKWQEEHVAIVVHSHKVLAEYSKNNHENAKKELVLLNHIAIDHMMDEDIELYKLLKDEHRLDDKTEKLVKEFTLSFKSTKLNFMNFLTHYSKPESILDNTFFTTFNEIIEVLSERIAFEEKNLYSKLNDK